MDGGYNPRTVEEVFRDLKGRRAGLIKALTTGSLLPPMIFFFVKFHSFYANLCNLLTFCFSSLLQMWKIFISSVTRVRFCLSSLFNLMVHE